MSDEIILDVRNITKVYPGVTALDDVSLQIKKGEIHALVGENGAGKSTLIKILSGVTKATRGSFFVHGKTANFSSPMEARDNGISVVHQELKLVDALTVAENIFLGRPRTSGSLGLVDKKKQNREARQLLDSLNCSLSETAYVRRLSVAQKQLVEIAKALSLDAEIIIMDEPSATLTDNELEMLFQTLEMLRTRGVTIIYISHRLEEIFRLADRFSVLRDGKRIDTLYVKDVDRKKLIELMVGRSVENEYPKKKVPIGDALLEVEGLTRRGAFENISFKLHRGEILGIAGLVGAGRTELVRAIFGADKKTSGSIKVNCEKVCINNTCQAIIRRMGLVPEERKTQGVVLGMSIKENISMAGMNNVLKRGLISKKKEASLARTYIEKLKIATPDEKRTVKNLSGGNQQKVVLAKWMAVDSDILLFDEPTRGIDVGAKAEIYTLLSDIVSSGKGIIMVSSELPELIGMCDRILVMHEGKMTGEVSAQEASQEIIMEYATQGN